MYNYRSVVCSFPTKEDKQRQRIFQPTKVSKTNDFHGGNKYFPNMVLIFILMPSICRDGIFQEKRIRLSESRKSCQVFQLSILKFLLIRNENGSKFLINFMSFGYKINRKMCFVSFNILHLLAALKTCPMSCLP